VGEGYTGGGREFERVASELRARMTDGTYPSMSVLPTQRALAEEFGVSRDTVARVLRELCDEGWIETRQGSRSRVLRTRRVHSPAGDARPEATATLGSVVGRAFEQPEVTLDVFTLTSQALDAHLRLQAERIFAGQITPRRITVRLLLPSESVDLPYWRSGRDAHDRLLRDRFLAVERRATESLGTVFDSLRATRLVPQVDLEIRRTWLAPIFKLYVVNRAEVLFGPYEVYRRPIALDDGRTVETTDVSALDIGLTHHVKDVDPRSRGTAFVEGMESWFDSVWENITIS
jgi:DNA-binding transcriptional regulator YhcF (GntR family)